MKNLQTVNNSMTSVLSKNIENVNACKNKAAVVDCVVELFTANGINTEASNRLVKNIKKSKSFESALFTVYNSILAGCGDEVIK